MTGRSRTKKGFGTQDQYQFNRVALMGGNLSITLVMVFVYLVFLEELYRCRHVLVHETEGNIERTEDRG